MFDFYQTKVSNWIKNIVVIKFPNKAYWEYKWLFDRTVVQPSPVNGKFQKFDSWYFSVEKKYCNAKRFRLNLSNKKASIY